jgi:hypothetical protein
MGKISLCSTKSKPTLGPNLQAVQWIPSYISLEIKRVMSEDAHSASLSAVKNDSVTSPHPINLHNIVLSS